MKNAVMAPITKITESAVSEYSNKGDIRATIKIPAVTIVAAWIKAEIGVGPSMESGSHTCNGTCADLPMAPTNNSMQMPVITDQAAPGKTSILRPAMAGAALKTSA